MGHTSLLEMLDSGVWETWEGGRLSRRQIDGHASWQPEDDLRMLLESLFWGRWWRKTHGKTFLGQNTRLGAEFRRCEVPAPEHTLQGPGGGPPDTAALSGGRRVGGPLPPPRTLFPALGAALSPADCARGKVNLQSLWSVSEPWPLQKGRLTAYPRDLFLFT